LIDENQNSNSPFDRADIRFRGQHCHQHHAVYPHRQHLSRRLRVFIEWLEPLLRERLFA